VEQAYASLKKEAEQDHGVGGGLEAKNVWTRIN
jgi:hypothetical protein